MTRTSMGSRARTFCALAALTGTSACLHRHSETAALRSLPAPIPPASGEIRTPFAMRYLDEALGTGAPAEAGQCFYAHYTGWLTDGKKFDSSRDTTAQGKPRKPLPFLQGARQVIPGWDAGFEGMRVGGRRRLYIPYQLAYGERGRPPTIPPRSMLIFDVELMDVRPAPAPAPAGQPAPRCPEF